MSRRRKKERRKKERKEEEGERVLRCESQPRIPCSSSAESESSSSPSSSSSSTLLSSSEMCSRGVWQLKRLTLVYSPKHPTSLGVREWVGSPRFEEFVSKNPQLKVHKYQKHIVSPYLKGEYGQLLSFPSWFFCFAGHCLRSVSLTSSSPASFLSFLLPAVHDQVKYIPVKQASPEDIEKAALKLRNQSFRKFRLRKWSVCRTPSHHKHTHTHTHLILPPHPPIHLRLNFGCGLFAPLTPLTGFVWIFTG